HTQFWLEGIVGRVLRISDADIQQTLSAEDFVASCDEAFRLYGSGEMWNPERREEMRREGGLDDFRLELPAEWPGRYRSRKVIEERSDVATGRLGHRTAVIELEDLRMGQRAVLDAGHITDMRTGAAGALGARYLARDPVSTVAILGTGRIARALALCADLVLRPKEVRATSRHPANREAFEASVGPGVSAELRMTDSVQACVTGADVVLAAVPTPEPILMAGDVSEDTHLSVIGGDTRTAQLDLDLLCSRHVVVDHPEQAKRSGDFRRAESLGRLHEIRLATGDHDRVLTIGDAAMGRAGHLRGTGAIAYFTGLGVQDLAAAAAAYEGITEVE
ncbi:MAG: NAD(P)-binding domain-containing protein, partial [Candidatus Latescibacteria bacterium]|nr:NAD(P)-binding domain-containing protein [Candidatus Latescibacterota bacterium]